MHLKKQVAKLTIDSSFVSFSAHIHFDSKTFETKHFYEFSRQAEEVKGDLMFELADMVAAKFMEAAKKMTERDAIYNAVTDLIEASDLRAEGKIDESDAKRGTAMCILIDEMSKRGMIPEKRV